MLTQITPRPGESPTAALFRQHDRFAGAGLSDTDRTAIACQDKEHDRTAIAELQRALDAARRELAARHAAEVAGLRQALAEANAQIAALQEQLAAVIAVVEAEADDQALPWCGEGGE